MGILEEEVVSVAKSRVGWAICKWCGWAIRERDGVWVHRDRQPLCPNGIDKAQPRDEVVAK